MVHPSELVRVNSDVGREFSAPTNMGGSESIDCGIKAIPCLNRVFNLEKYARPAVFISVLSLVGFIHGALIIYFRGTWQIWAKNFNMDPSFAEWFIYINEVFVGVFALFISEWGYRFHRATWLGSLTIYHAIACILLLVVDIYHPNKLGATVTMTESSLCKPSNRLRVSPEDENLNYSAIVLLIIFQMFFAIVTVSFTSHGITYMDDNISPKHSPAYIGLALASKELGKQMGIYFSWIPLIFEFKNIFFSSVWLVLAAISFILGIVICLFPRELPSITIRRVAASILDLASGVSVHSEEEEPKKDGFCTKLWRLLRNKILMVNILAALLMQSAIINFGILENDYNQARFHTSNSDNTKYNDPSVIQFTTNLLKQPIIALFMILCGVLIAKVRPKTRSVIIWNIVVFSLVTIFFASSGFWKCAGEIKNDSSNAKKLTIPYCSKCVCNLNMPFEPICLNKETYYNPCFAGCQVMEELNDYTIYKNCSCSMGNTATAGSCERSNCNILMGISQVNNIISSGLVGSTIVSNLVINMRCILPTDKALALGLEATLIGLVPYIPVKLIYGELADKFCKYVGNENVCKFYSEDFATFMSSSTVLLMGLAAATASILLFLINDLNLFKINKHVESEIELNNMDDDVDGIRPARISRIGYSDSYLDRHRGNNESDTLIDRNVGNNNGSKVGTPLHNNFNNSDRINSKTSELTTDSLRDLENNVGDDHDSDDTESSVADRHHPTYLSVPNLNTVRESATTIETDF